MRLVTAPLLAILLAGCLVAPGHHGSPGAPTEEIVPGAVTSTLHPFSTIQTPTSLTYEGRVDGLLLWLNPTTLSPLYNLHTKMSIKFTPERPFTGDDAVLWSMINVGKADANRIDAIDQTRHFVAGELVGMAVVEDHWARNQTVHAGPHPPERIVYGTLFYTTVPGHLSLAVRMGNHETWTEWLPSIHERIPASWTNDTVAPKAPYHRDLEQREPSFIYAFADFPDRHPDYAMEFVLNITNEKFVENQWWAPYDPNDPFRLPIQPLGVGVGAATTRSRAVESYSWGQDAYVMRTLVVDIDLVGMVKDALGQRIILQPIYDVL